VLMPTARKHKQNAAAENIAVGSTSCAPIVIQTHVAC
jgi:hypothetical protein